MTWAMRVDPVVPAKPHQCGGDEECLVWWCQGCGRWMPWCWGHDVCADCDECCDDECVPVDVEVYAEDAERRGAA